MQKTGLLLLTLLLFLTSVVTVYASVDIESFTGVWQETPDQVVLEFSTASEINHAAFNVWRSDTNISPSAVNTGTATLLNNELIIGETPCSVTGSDYTYTDTTVAADAEGYYYYLESFACTSGGSTFYGALDIEDSGLLVSNPSSTTESTTYLPLISVAPPTP